MKAALSSNPHTLQTLINERTSLNSAMADKNFKPLTIEPVNFSLTAGTNIPAPPDSPPPTPRDDKPADGVVSGLPSTPQRIPGAPPSPIEEGDDEDKVLKHDKLPLSPASTTSGQRKQPSGIRKFLSLRSLRGDRRSPSSKNPLSPESQGSTDSTAAAAAAVTTPLGRPGSPYTVMSASSQHSLRRKRSSGWFASTGRRKSTMFLIGRLDEKMDHVSPEEAERLRKLRMGPPPPTIPEFYEFKSLGAELDGGTLGSEQMFKDIK